MENITSFLSFRLNIQSYCNYYPLMYTENNIKTETIGAVLTVYSLILFNSEALLAVIYDEILSVS